MQCISNEYDTWNLFACNCTNHISRGMPVAGCAVKAAAAVVAREEEEVAAALLDEQLW